MTDSQGSALDEAIQRIYTADYPEGTKRELKAFLAQEVNKARLEEIGSAYHSFRDNPAYMREYFEKRLKQIERPG